MEKLLGLLPTATIQDWLAWLLAGLTAVVLVAALAFVTVHAVAFLRQRDWVGLMGVGTMGIALALNAEGMYYVITKDMPDVPKLLVWGVFFVFEAFQVQLMVLAEKRYRDPAFKHPGKYAWLVWAIGLVSGLIVSIASTTTTEKVLRIALPVMVAAVWHVCLVADGVKKRTSKWAVGYKLEAWLRYRGWMMPLKDGDEDIDFDQNSRALKIKRIVTMRYKLDRGGLLKWYREIRLDRMILKADDGVLDDVAVRLETVRQARAELNLKAAQLSVPASRTDGTKQNVPVQPSGTSQDGTPVRLAGTEDGTAGTVRDDVPVRPSGTEIQDGTVADPVPEIGTANDDTIVEEGLDIWRRTGSVPTVSQVASLAVNPNTGRPAGQSKAKRLRDLMVVAAMREENGSGGDPGE